MNFDKNIKIKYQFQNYDSNWAKKFEEIKLFLQSVFGKKALKIEHFGSTAVPGMKAKPVIDIVVVVGKMEDFLEQRQKMIFAGYEWKEHYIAPKTQLFYRTADDGNKTENIHICESGSPQEKQWLVMRDFFRAFPKKAKEYADLKEKIFALHPNDYVAYREAKASFLERMEKEAYQWYEGEIKKMDNVMENLKNIKKVTLYQDINNILFFLAQGIRSIFDDDLMGFYLTGSLSYGDFDEGRSDIDLAVVLKKPVSAKKIDSVKQLHLDVERTYKNWANRIECSYIPLDTLQNILPPKNPRPYIGEGKFYPKASYGNEWLINKFFLYKYGIALIGPDFKTLVKPINIVDIEKASVRDLYKEWEPKITDITYLENSHYQSYVVLNLCRILYTVMRSDAVSKKVAALWAEKEYPQWKNLIETADNWHYGVKMERQKETVEFIKFAIVKIKEQGLA